MTIETGGPAFPLTRESSVSKNYEGMTLRDWFAGQALAGAIAESAERSPGISRADELALFAYACADAMLKARGES